ncbi:MAG: hypothetical protein DWQ36_13875 [Acidobacteria bacterium]|nr:MAG: hypothetical protein DWQ30_20080 [Acidobacteriota bacterium]REK06296.1 MAG: hypothetical protein DWQ36_13875 [Acidobacteriota bacterium]
MALGFLTLLQTVMFLSFGLDLEAHWSEQAIESRQAALAPEDAERLLRLGLGIGLPLAGAVVAACQAWVLRGHLPRIWQWILCAPAGFAAIILAIWPFTAIWGDIPGPVEPFTIVGGGLLAAAGLQWLLLRRRHVQATRWLVLWIVGLPLGMITFMVAYTLLDALVSPSEKYSISWASEVALIGFFVGGTAAAISGTALFRALSSRLPEEWA